MQVSATAHIKGKSFTSIRQGISQNFCEHGLAVSKRLLGGRKSCMKNHKVKNKRQLHIEMGYSKYSNRAVILILHSPKYYNRRVTKKTTQFQPNRPKG